MHFNDNGDCFPWVNVSNGDCENFSSLLFDNCSGVTLIFCFFVLNTSSFTFLDLSGDFTIANLHGHAGHGGTNRQWESKYRFGRLIKWVLKSCFDGPYNAVAVYCAVDVNCGDREICVTCCEPDAREFLFCVCSHNHDGSFSCLVDESSVNEISADSAVVTR